jgi:hypothetical protein
LPLLGTTRSTQAAELIRTLPESLDGLERTSGQSGRSWQMLEHPTAPSGAKG